MPDASATGEQDKVLSPPRNAVLHAWVTIEIAQIFEARAAELKMHVDHLVADLLTKSAIDYVSSRRRRDK